MDEDTQEETPNTSGYSRYRSPTFNRKEVKDLIGIIEKYKIIIMNKSTNAAATHAKDVAWAKITKIFNSRGYKHKRSVENLKVKWDNLKKDAKKVSKNLLDVEHNEFDYVTSQIITLLSEAENNSNANIPEETSDFDEELNEIQEDKATHNLWEQEENKSKNADDNDVDQTRAINRSMNFTPEESSLLLQCVRQEKKLVFCKSNSIGANILKNKAWNRITNSYNKLSPHKRSTKVLRTKFTNMKKFAKCVNFKHSSDYFKRKHEKLKDDTVNEIKSEPYFGYGGHSDADSEDMHKETSDGYNFIPDPLSTVLNSDSGIDLINPSENKEAVKLKIQLLNYKMETAKLERKRLEDTMQTEAVVNAFRLRAARLEAVAAAAKLQPPHPALNYTVEELPAQKYLLNYNDP